MNFWAGQKNSARSAHSIILYLHLAPTVIVMASWVRLPIAPKILAALQTA